MDIRKIVIKTLQSYNCSKHDNAEKAYKRKICPSQRGRRNTLKGGMRSGERKKVHPGQKEQHGKQSVADSSFGFPTYPHSSRMCSLLSM
jgi:hypothetical protein